MSNIHHTDWRLFPTSLYVFTVLLRLITIVRLHSARHAGVNVASVVRVCVASCIM